MGETTTNERLRVLWISPLYPHYRMRNAARLVATKDVDMTVLMAATPEADGYRLDGLEPSMRHLTIDVSQRGFALHPVVYWHIATLLWTGRPSVVICPIEKMFSPVLLYCCLLRLFFGFKLMTYCHQSTRSRNRRTPGGSGATRFDVAFTKAAFRLYDRIIFYTEAARDASVAAGIAPAKKAWFANNTLDTSAIEELTSLAVNRSPDWTIAFIGRLDARKRIDLLLEYYRGLKRAHRSTRLLVIGDGPDADLVRAAAAADPDIVWRGSVITERLIAEDMRSTHVVLLPGASGLSIVHAFAYGKPFLTCGGPAAWHGPEIAYLEDGRNGMLLSGDVPRDVARVAEMLSSPEVYAAYCRSARETAEAHSIARWCEQFYDALHRRGPPPASSPASDTATAADSAAASA